MKLKINYEDQSSRHVQSGNTRPMIQPHLAYAIGVVKKDIFPENAQILPRYNLGYMFNVCYYLLLLLVIWFLCIHAT
jgi:hypothetical protein